MTEHPFDILLDTTPYTELPTAMLQHLAGQGDEEAKAELDRRTKVAVHGPEIEDDSPITERPDEVLLKQIAAGDEAAAVEYMRRHTVGLDDARSALGKPPLER